MRNGTHEPIYKIEKETNIESKFRGRDKFGDWI